MAMNYIREVFSDAKLRYQINRVINDCIADNNKLVRYERERTKRANDRLSSASVTKCHSPMHSNGSVNNLVELNEINSKVESTAVAEAIKLADEHPEEILTALRTRLSYANAEVAYSSLKLLETLVSSCNYSLHLSLSKNRAIHERLLNLAIRRAEDVVHRLTQRLARLTILEYSRMFIDDLELAPLARLAGTFELRTGKNLLRCLNVQKHKVKFRDPGPKDVIMLSELESTTNSNSSSTNTCCTNGCCDNVNSSSYNHNGSTSSCRNNNEKNIIVDGAHKNRFVKPIKLSAAEVWPCHVCGYLNAPSASCCASCETPRFSDTSNVHQQHRKIQLHSTAHFLASQEELPPLPENECTTALPQEEQPISKSTLEQKQELKSQEHAENLSSLENAEVPTCSTEGSPLYKVSTSTNNEKNER